MKRVILFLILALPVLAARNFRDVSSFAFTAVNSATCPTFSNFTLQAWVKIGPPYGGSGRMAVIFGKPDVSKCVFIARSGSAATFSGGHYDGSTLYSSTAALSSNAWHHVLLSRSSSTSMIIWVDGVAVVTNASAQTYSTGWATNWSLGNYGDGAGSGNFQGDVAEVAFWNVSLSAGEILALASGLAANRVRPASLFHYSPLYGHGGSATSELDVVSVPVPRRSGTTNPPVTDHPRIFR